MVFGFRAARVSSRFLDYRPWRGEQLASSPLGGGCPRRSVCDASLGFLERR
jgi:hypothetical protein